MKILVTSLIMLTAILATITDGTAADPVASASPSSAHDQPQPAISKPVVAPGLHADERTALALVLERAVALGFPDLMKATVHCGPYRMATDGEHIDHPIIHLADGTWLIHDGLILAADAVTDAGAPLAALPNDNDAHVGDVSPDDQARARANGGQWMVFERVYPYDRHLTECAAIMWWQSGADPDGRALVRRLLLPDDGPHRAFTEWNSSSRLIPPAASVPLDVHLRHHCAALFRARAAWAANRSESVRWVEAARAILESAERPAWEPGFAILIQRWDIPVTTPSGSDLATRLQSWDQITYDPHTRKDRIPATRADTAALIALLDDERPSRWLDNGIPRTLGDNALRALNAVWRLDWRLIACADPQVARTIEAMPAGWRRSDSGLPFGKTWTPAMRQAVSAGIRHWWQSGDRTRPGAVLAGAIPWFPVQRWNTLMQKNRDQISDLVADACSQALRQLPMPGEDEDFTELPILVMHFPHHAGLVEALTSWPVLNSSMAERIQHLLHLRASWIAGDTTLDAWFEEWSPWCDGTWTLRNLGLLAVSPTTARRDRIVALLQQTKDERTLMDLLPNLGCAHLSSLLDPATHPQPLAIPAALAVAALADQRLIPAARPWKKPGWEHRWTSNIDDDIIALLKRLDDKADLRICDWTVAVIIQQRRTWTLDPLPVGVDNDPNKFLKRPITERDKAIAALKDAMQDIVRETAEKAGWVKSPDAGNRF